MELEALRQSLPEIQKAGAALIAISPMREPYLRQMAGKNHLAFDLLRDQGNTDAGEFGLVFSLPQDLRELYKTFGIDLMRFNGDDSREIRRWSKGNHPQRGYKPGLHRASGSG